AGILEQKLLDGSYDQQCDRGVRTDMAGTAAMRAGLHGRFENAGANALTAHFHQPEMGDAAELYPCAIVLEVLLEPLLDSPIVAVFLHIDEIDDDQTGEIPQSELAGHFFRCFQIRMKRR